MLLSLRVKTERARACMCVCVYKCLFFNISPMWFDPHARKEPQLIQGNRNDG